MKLFLYFILSGTVLGTLLFPWIGVLAYYTLALLMPQLIWGWIFQDMRISLYVSIVTIVSFMISVFIRKTDFSILKNKQNLYVIILWISLIISYIFSPYGENETYINIFNSTYLISTMSKIFLFYFVSIVLIDTREKLHYLIIVFILTIIYYTYWANDMYLSGRMTALGFQRLGGPGSVYNDENTFAMLFVMGVPFLYFMGNYYKNKYIKYLLWGVIPFAWHAIFLTGSRGGLVGISVVTLFITVKSKSKILGLAMVAALLVAYVWQAGDTMRERGSTIIITEDEETEGSIQGRFDAWKAGYGMMRDYPVTGVGLGNFVKAFSDYSDKKVRVAHNTIIQLAAEAGFFAGLMYLLISLNVFSTCWKQRGLVELGDQFLGAVNSSIFCSLIGFFICSLFLNLAGYETFYYLLILSIVHNKIVRNKDGEAALKPR